MAEESAIENGTKGRRLRPSQEEMSIVPQSFFVLPRRKMLCPRDNKRALDAAGLDRNCNRRRFVGLLAPQEESHTLVFQSRSAVKVSRCVDRSKQSLSPARRQIRKPVESVGLKDLRDKFGRFDE